jgi:hypothetical protein
VVANSGPLLAKNGAQFHGRIELGGYNQVRLVTQVRLGDRREPEPTQITSNEAMAHDIADQFAKDAGFPAAIWDQE